MLRALGAFVGGFDLAGVAAVVGLAYVATVDVIESLVARSLVVHDQIDGRSRYRLFETTAAYARQRLVDEGEAADVRDRHLDHFYTHALEHPLAMAADLSARQHVGPDRANVAAAFDSAATHDQWVTAAELLLGVFTVFDASPSEGIALTADQF